MTREQMLQKIAKRITEDLDAIAAFELLKYATGDITLHYYGATYQQLTDALALLPDKYRVCPELGIVLDVWETGKITIEVTKKKPTKEHASN